MPLATPAYHSPVLPGVHARQRDEKANSFEGGAPSERPAHGWQWAPNGHPVRDARGTFEAVSLLGRRQGPAARCARAVARTGRRGAQLSNANATGKMQPKVVVRRRDFVNLELEIGAQALPIPVRREISSWPFLIAALSWL